MAEVEFYDYDVELYTKYEDKNIVLLETAFAFLRSLKINKSNLFLLRSCIYERGNL